jgi:hypothetical protein
MWLCFEFRHLLGGNQRLSSQHVLFCRGQDAELASWTPAKGQEARPISCQQKNRANIYLCILKMNPHLLRDDKGYLESSCFCCRKKLWPFGVKWLRSFLFELYFKWLIWVSKSAYFEGKCFLHFKMLLYFLLLNL